MKPGHNWKVSQNLERDCDCRHSDCKEKMIYARYFHCENCGQKAYQDNSYSVPDAGLVGLSVLGCEDFRFRIGQAIKRSLALRDEIKTKLQVIDERSKQ